ncbi:MAG: MBL fold metallo-hydrolase [Lachnospiraceae bacterium]|nr:MBL fold metallo-hydrolase [Lachnospiraceae bacterium]
MKLYIAGGASEHGRNSFLVEGKSVRILVDCGLMREPDGSSKPFLTDEQIKNIDYLFLTHCHADHAGAVMWLYERGFRGIVIASRFTLDIMSGPVRECRVLEELGERGTKIPLEHGLSVTWGRSGHCFGSVWLLFSAEGKKILFSGDYVEKSTAYKCDRIRDVAADLAVIDTAYGTKGGTCRENLRAFRKYAADEYAAGRTDFYPVPSHGRGLDVIRVLIETGCEVYADEYLIQELRDTENRKSWLRKGMIRASESEHLHPLMQFPIGYACVLRARQRWQQGSGNYLKVKEYSEKSIVPGSAIVVPDTQIAKEWNRDTALHIYDAGGRVVLTGKQIPGGCASRFLAAGKADFLRISVHQTADELLTLRRKNRFTRIVPFHSAEQMSFAEKNIFVMRPMETIEF